MTEEEYQSCDIAVYNWHVRVCMPGGAPPHRFALPFRVSASVGVSARLAGGKLVLAVKKELRGDAPERTPFRVFEGVSIPASDAVPPRTRPRVRVEQQTGEVVEAVLPPCSFDVTVGAVSKMVDVAVRAITFEFLIRERTQAGTVKTLKGSQVLRIMLTCGKDDMSYSVENGTLRVTVKAPRKNAARAGDSDANTLAMHVQKE